MTNDDCFVCDLVFVNLPSFLPVWVTAVLFFIFFFFFFNDTATTEIYTLSLHDALPICPGSERMQSVPAVCAIPSSTRTPGITGLLGKWPTNCGSLAVTFLMPMPC